MVQLAELLALHCAPPRAEEHVHSTENLAEAQAGWEQAELTRLAWRLEPCALRCCRPCHSSVQPAPPWLACGTACAGKACSPRGAGLRWPLADWGGDSWAGHRLGWLA